MGSWKARRGVGSWAAYFLRGAESLRAQLTQTCSNASRHVLDDSETSMQVLANELVEAARLVPNASIERLVDGLVMLPEEKQQGLVKNKV